MLGRGRIAQVGTTLAMIVGRLFGKDGLDRAQSPVDVGEVSKQAGWGHKAHFGAVVAPASSDGKGLRSPCEWP